MPSAGRRLDHSMRMLIDSTRVFNKSGSGIPARESAAPREANHHWPILLAPWMSLTGICAA
jgi:hypothetical protein